MNTENRDYSTISPSAKMLLLMKGYTDIPFMKEAATLAMQPEAYVQDMNSTDARFWARVLHFEERYKSVNQLLTELDAQNILELSSGFSFRGLDMVQHKSVHYIDTDLPDVIHTKQALVDALNAAAEHKGKLELLPLNALDEAALNEIVSRFPDGPVAIVNEGLLMYLGMEEKTRLAAIIHKALKQHGGCWITADIYQQMDMSALGGRESSEDKFFREHNIEANKFDSFDAAKAFFTANGFEIDKEATTDPSQLTSLPYFIKTIPAEKLKELQGREKMRVTWRLRAV
jgi:O-methyltransferase involved in polyketide biosynthesis